MPISIREVFCFFAINHTNHFFCFSTKDILLLTYMLHRLFLFLLQPKRCIFVYLLFALFMGPCSMVDGCKGSSRLVDCCYCTCSASTCVCFFFKNHFCNIILFTMYSLSLTLFLFPTALCFWSSHRFIFIS